MLNVIANQTNPNTLLTGGVAEFDGIANPTIALQGSGTADAPYIKIYLNTTGRQGISLNFNAIDIDGSADNAVQPIAVQYRVGNTGAFTNIPTGFVADASTGPSLSGNTTAVAVVLPAAAENQAQVEVRIITSNAASNDEWIGIDDIVVSSAVLPITFSRFSGLAVDNGVQLNWLAFATTANGLFTVERSADGRSFSPLANINALTGDRQYNYTDRNAIPAVAYYRVAFTENGNIKYSSVIRIAASKQSFALTRFVTISDNRVEMEIYSDRNAPATLRIMGMNGVLLQQQDISLQKGTQVIDINLATAAKGACLITLYRGEETITRQWVR